MSLETVVRSSEFWLGLVGIVLTGAVSMGWIEQELYNTVIAPLMIYVGGRATSKIVKSVKK